MNDQKNEIEEHLTRRSTWVRMLFMILFGFIFWLSSMVLCAAVIIQFLHVLFSGEKNEILLRRSYQLEQYFSAIIAFLTYRSDERPFPFAEWPDGGPGSESGVRQTKAATRRKTSKKSASGTGKSKKTAG